MHLPPDLVKDEGEKNDESYSCDEKAGKVIFETVLLA